MRWIAIGLWTCLFAAPALAQDADTRRYIEKTLEDVLRQRYETGTGLSVSESTRLDYGGYVTLDVLLVDDEGGATRTMGQSDLRLWANVSNGGHSAFGRFRVRYRAYDGDDGAAFDDDDGLTWPMFDRYWYRFDLRDELRARKGDNPSWNVWAQGGRQQVDWGSGITLSETLYSALFGVEASSFVLMGLVGVTPVMTTVDFDASRPEYDTNTDRLFWGVLAECRALTEHRPYIFFLDQRDNNQQPLFADFEYNSSYIGVGSRGQFSGNVYYHGEFIYEFGDSMSDPLAGPQSQEDISAWALQFEVAWMPRQSRSNDLRFALELLLASGDSDRRASSQTIGGNAPGSDDSGFNAFGFAYTGLALAPDLSNLASIRFSASLRPLADYPVARRLRATLDSFLLMKLNSDAPVSVLSEEDEMFLGVEFDLVVEWEVYSDLAVDCRYGIFLPLAAAAENDPRNFFYFGVSYGF